MDAPSTSSIIGAGPAGEAAAYKARELGASVAIVDRELVRRQLPAHRLRARRSRCSTAPPGTPRTRRRTTGRARRRAATTWSTAPPDAAEPDDAGHVRGARGGRRGRLPRRRRGSSGAGGSRSPTTASRHELGARNVVVAVGSVSKVPPLEGIDDVPTWTNREATLARELPAQPARPRRRPDRLRARPGLRPVRRPDDDRPVRAAARPDRPPAQLRGGPGRARARRRRRSGSASGPSGRTPAPGPDGAARASTSTTARPPTGHAVLLAVGRDVPARRPRPRALRRRHDRADAVPARRPAAHRRRPVDRRRPGGPRAPHPPGATTRASSPSGWRWARPSRPTTAPCPRATYTDPEAASVGRDARPGAAPSGLDAFELVADFPKTAKGYSVEATIGHVTIVVDRAVAPARRRGDGLPGRLGGHPRVRPRDQGRRPGRRPGRDDPRLPVDVADPQRAVRRRAARARAGPAASSARSRYALEDDLAVHQDHRRAGRRERAARLDGVVEAAAGMTTMSAR